MPNELEFIIYSTPEEDIRIDAAVKDESIWLTQKGMAALFDCSSDNISPICKTFTQMENWQKMQLPRKSR